MAPHVKSKRRTLRHKYKVERKVREHHRKSRRANKARLSGPAPKSKRKDPGIPNLWPFKQEILEDIERRRVEAREARISSRAAAKNGEGSGVAELANEASRRADAFDATEDAGAQAGDAPLTSPESRSDGSRKAFMKEFRRVVDSADVILEVLDARDPIGCRCFDAEKAVLAASGGSKRIVLVLNKVDLVPKEVVERWLTYLRNEFPTVAFRASIQSGSGAIGQASVTPLSAAQVGTSDCLGASTLLSVLKNYTRSKNIKTSVTVGVIGFPNVGKSSLINSLKRTRAVSAGAMPGVTRSAQEVHLDKNIRLLDCPGIVFSNQSEDALVLRNCIKIEEIADPVSPVETILKRIGAEPLMEAYSLPSFDNIVELLALVAKLRGRYKRGGVLDVCAAAVVILKDWNSGKIPFYTLPPKGPRRAHISAAVVKDWGQEFNIDEKMKQVEASALAGLDTGSLSGPTPVAVSAMEGDDADDFDIVDDDDDDDDDAMDESADGDKVQLTSGTRANDEDEAPSFHAGPRKKGTSMECNDL